MTDSDGQDSQARPRRRRSFDVSGDEIDVREDLEGDDGVFEVRMPIATTGEVRNDGDEPLTRDELSGMARQIDSRDVPVFLDHGQSELGGSYSRYSAMEKVGEWREADVGERDGGDSDQLVATARMMDPETLPAATGDLREALAAIKEQVERGFSLSSSIGWRDDESYPGGVDLMEASIVGIGADPRTTSDAAVALARAATVASDADDPDAVVERFREVTHDMTDDDTDPDEGTDRDDEPDESRDAPEWAERMLELQEQTADTLSDVADAIREDDEDGDDEEDDPDEENESDDGDEEDDDEDDEQSSEPDEEQGLRDEVESLREQLDEIRDGGLSGEDVDTPDTDGEQDATDDSGGEDDLAKYNIR